MKLIPVKYHGKNYPEPIVPQLNEVAGNLDSKQISEKFPYSLHTEYSYMKRSLDSNLLDGLDELKSAHKGGIPQLWKNVKWSEEYAIFLERLIGDSIDPEVIEIHPPFKDYCKDLNAFWECYLVFFHRISSKYPRTKIMIENRCGTMYTGATFLFSTCSEMLELCEFLAAGHTELGIIIDYPQLFSAEKVKMDDVKIEKILSFNESIKSVASTVSAIHLWGKRKSQKGKRWTAHTGDLNTFFSGDIPKKEAFLQSIREAFSDEKERYFIPEVNSSEGDLVSIINDMLKMGIIFVQKESSEYLISVDWMNRIPQFVVSDTTKSIIRRYDAVGKLSVSVSAPKHCVGNKNPKTHDFLGCPTRMVLTGRKSKCPHCEENDALKYCVRCTGKRCFVKDPTVLSRCNQEHFVYLAFFPGDIVKVGVCHGERKYARLFEQGALYAYFIATCRSGKLARQLETIIRSKGVKDRVSSSYKVQHIEPFELGHADKLLSSVLASVAREVKHHNTDGIVLFERPEKFIREDALLVLLQTSDHNSDQLTFWNIIEDNGNESASIKILHDLSEFTGEIITFFGSIALLRKDNAQYLFDFKKIYGREVSFRQVSYHP